MFLKPDNPFKRLPRKQKKLFKKKEIIFKRRMSIFKVKDYYNWIFHKQMVIVRNYLMADIPLIITKEYQTWINNGLLK